MGLFIWCTNPPLCHKWFLDIWNWLSNRWIPVISHSLWTWIPTLIYRDPAPRGTYTTPRLAAWPTCLDRFRGGRLSLDWFTTYHFSKGKTNPEVKWYRYNAVGFGYHLNINLPNSPWQSQVFSAKDFEPFCKKNCELTRRIQTQQMAVSHLQRWSINDCQGPKGNQPFKAPSAPRPEFVLRQP